MLQSDEAVVVKSADLLVNLGDVLFDAAKHGPEHLKTIFPDPAAKLRGYHSLAQLLIPRLGPHSGLQTSLTEVLRAGELLLATLQDRV